MAKRTRNRERPTPKPASRRNLYLGLIALVAIAGVAAVVDEARALGRAHGAYRLLFQLRDGPVAEELFNTGGL